MGFVKDYSRNTGNNGGTSSFEKKRNPTNEPADLKTLATECLVLAIRTLRWEVGGFASVCNPGIVAVSIDQTRGTFRTKVYTALLYVDSSTLN